MTPYELGQRAMLDIVNYGQRIDTYLAELSSESDFDKQVLAGAVNSLSSVYWNIHALGVVPRFEDESLHRFMHSGPNAMAARMNPMLEKYARLWLDKHLTAVARVVHEHRVGRKYGLTAQAAPAPEPMPVRVMTLPDRVTESSVQYDAAGNIKSTKQTEKDAV